MIGCEEDVFGTQQLAERVAELGSELLSTVGQNALRSAVLIDPVI